MRYRNDLKRLAIFSGVVLLVLALLYGGVHVLEDAVLKPASPAEPQIVSRTVTWKGTDYYPRGDVTVLMLLGLDRQASALDTVLVLALDETEESCSVLRLDPDTMLDIPAPGSGGKEADRVYDRLELAYSGSSDPEAGCIAACRAVSDFLGGITIDYYIAADMDTAAIVSDGLDGAADAGAQPLDSVWELLSDMPELVTDCPLHVLVTMPARYGSYRFSGVVTPEGEYAAEGADAFYPDGEKLMELTIGLFYEPKRGQING